MKKPIILSGPSFPWGKPNPHGEVITTDGEVNWAAAAFADPGVMKCPSCGIYLWNEGDEVKCPDCFHVWLTRSGLAKRGANE